MKRRNERESRDFRCFNYAQEYLEATINLVDVIRRATPDWIKDKAKRLLGLPLTTLHDDWSVLRVIGPVGSHHVVFDVGAHQGWFFHCWLKWCPTAQIHAFEPTGASFDKLTKAFGSDDRVSLNRKGIGAVPGVMALNVLAESQVSNSFLDPNQVVWDAIEYRTGDVHTEDVPVTTLDYYCEQNSIGSVFLLKVDTQGFEMEVIKGAGKVLEQTDYVFVEAGIERLYKEAPSFAEVHLALEEKGFHLVTMRAWHRGNHRLVETDMLFRRNGLESDIDRETHRHYVELR